MKSNFTMIIKEETAVKPHLKDKKVNHLLYRVLSKLSFLFRTDTRDLNFQVPDKASVIEDTEGFALDENRMNYLPNTLESYPKSSINMKMLSSSHIKEYPLGSHFDETKKKWITKTTMSNRLIINPLASIILMLFSVLGVSAQNTPVDLSLRKQIDNSVPTLNSNVKYTLWLINKGTNPASTVVVKDMFPIAGATLVSHTGGANFTYDALTGVGNWSVASVAAGDSVKLEITANVKERGVFFNTAEIFSMGAGQEDVDSSPNNSSLHEDDFAAACFSVPLYWYPGDEYEVTVPAPFNTGLGSVQWLRDGLPITSTTTQASVKNDTLTIKGIGEYTFNTTVSTCPATGCCAIKIIQGPYGSIGDYVWKDANNNGIQDTGEIPVKDVILELYKVDAGGNLIGSAIQKDTTDALGRYLFDSLMTGDYKVKIVSTTLPTGCVLSSKLDQGADDTKDNDFSLATFLSPKVSIYTDSTGIKKDNPTIDAALYSPLGSIGDYVWKDTDNDGVQDVSELGVKDVIVELWASDASGNPTGAAALKKDTTDATGFYQFTNLAGGDYVVKIVTTTLPTGCVLSSKQDLGGDDTKDSDFSSTTGLSPKITLDPTNTTDPLKKDNPTIDAALYSPLGSIGDYVWKDTDNDGVQDVSELGVKDVIVELWASDASGNPTGAAALKKDTTDATGFYQFTNLAGGDYVVKIVTTTLPTGCVLSSKTNQGTDDTKDSDFSSTTGLSPKITLDPTNTTDPLKKDNPTIDAALYSPLGSIGDYVWKDTDNDGVQDVSELGVKDVIVELWASDASGNPTGAAALKKDTTDATGFYQFTNLAGGDYVVKIVTTTLPTGCVLSSKTNQGTDDTKDSDFSSTTGLSPKITLDPTNTTDPLKKDNPTIDAALYSPLGSIGDYVWKDTNNNGLQDSGELGVKDVIIELWASDASGNPTGAAALKKDTTDATGFYQFTNLAGGDYVVKIVTTTLPTGCVLSSKQDLGGDDTKDSDFSSTTGLSPKITLDPTNTTDPLKKDNPTVDAALYSPLGSIGDYVWKDTNNNGLQDSGELGVKDVIIELWASDASGNPTGAAALKKDTTDATGFYQFTNLAGGDYVVKIVTTTLPTGCVLSSKTNQGTDDTKDSDFSSTTGLSPKITLDPTNTTDPLKKDNPTIDAAVYTLPLGSIGDFVWKDTDNDGIQDVSEAGVSGVIIELYTADAITGLPTGAVLKKDTTDATGKYLFTGLSAGNYVVKVVTSTLPTGCLLTSKQDTGSDDTKDSDFNPSTGLSDKIVIDPNDPLLKDNTTVDGGLYSPLGSIGNYVWKDTDNDGIQDATEIGVAGVVLELYAVDAQGNVSGSPIQKDTTDVNGYYLFGNLSKGDYKVKIITSSIPTDCLPSDKKDQGTDDTVDSDFDITTGFSPTISIDPTDPAKKDNSTIDGAVIPVPKGSIGDFVWKDLNNNGIQDIGEVGVGNVKVELYASDANGNPTGAALQTVFTASTGYYSFTNLAKGDYVVKIVTSTLPTDCLLSDKKDQGTDDTKDSDFNPTTGVSPKISIDPIDPTKKDISTVDGAVYTPEKGSIGDYVWKDTNDNGIQDGTETGVGGVIVQLWAANGTSPLKTDTTDASGKYLFSGLAKGDYYVKVVTTSLPTGCILTSKKDQGTDDAKDSDFDATTGVSPIISLDPADPTKKDILTIDGGLYSPLGSIGDFVWKDADNDGIQDIGEVGVANVKVELYASDANGNPTGAVLQTVFTASTGYYSFTNLAKGDYVVKIVTSTLPTDCLLSDKKDQGTDDTKDSDFNPTTGVSPKISIDPIDPTKKDISTVDGAVYTPPKGSIGDYVWKDTNDNGIQDGTETGVGGVVVQLWAANGTSPLSTTTTDASGKYLFSGLAKGDYYVKIVTSTIPTGCVLTSKKDQGTDDTKDSDFDATTGNSPIISIDPADPTKKDILTVDGGLYSPLGSIGDFVWKDLNDNGIQDVGEVGVEGVKLELYAADASGNPVGSAINTTSTNATGYYSFTNLPKGDYLVKIITNSLPTGCQPSTKVDQGGNDAKDSDFNPTTGFSPKISIDPVDPTKKDISTVDGAVYTPIVCPELIVKISDSDICMGDTTYVTVTSSNGGQINWYLSVVGGTPIETTASGELVEATPTTTTTYYVEVVGSQGCVRVPVTIVVNARPSNPTCTGVVEECEGKTVNLNSYIINGPTTPGGTFEWRVGPNPTSALVSNPTAVGAGTYYLFEKSGVGCYSNPTLLKVVLKPCDKLIDLSLTKTANNLTPAVGENITFTISVKNDGPDAATGVEVKDVLPANLQFVSSSQFTNASGTLTANISNIAAGQTIILNYVAKVINSSAGTNYAQVTKADQKDKDSTPGNGPVVDEDDNGKVVITPKVDEADLSLNKTVSNTTPTQGDVITYFIDVKNDGPVKATNVEVTDVVPAGLTVQSTSGADFVNVVGNTVKATFAQINVGETVQVKILAKVTGTGTVKNWAEITKSDQKDPDSTPNNGVDKNEDDDDDADITIKTPCNPTTPIIACMNPYICVGESVTIDAIGCNGTVVWSNGQTGAAITVSPTSTTVYSAQCKVGDCLSPKSNEVTIVVNSPAPPAITASATTICGGASTTLSATGCNGTITWSTGQTGASITVSPTVTTEYWATCKVRTCQSNPSNKIKITIGTPGNAPVISVSKDKICQGESVIMKVNDCSGTVVWSNGQNGASITVSPTTTTSYSAVCKVGECTSQKSADVTITVTPAQTPTITASKDNICVGESVTLTATGCTGTLTWSTGQTTSVITVTPTATIAYDATCASGACSGKASKIITVTPKPTAPIVTCGAERICAGEMLTFTAHNCDGLVTWSTGATGVSMTTTPAAPSTTYWATCTVNGCTSDKSKDAVITVLTETPTIVASSESICGGGGQVVLTASNCSGTLTWNTGATTPSITVTTASTYTVTCMVEGCAGTASKSISAGTGSIPSVPTISSNKTSVCGNETATLTATGCNGTVVWSTGSTGSSIAVGVGTYSATCKTDCGVSANSNTITIGTGTGSTIAITASKDGLCPGEASTLVVTGCNGTVLWSTGATTSSITVTPTATTTYEVTCKVGECSGKASKVITVSPKPTAPVVTCGAERICAGETLTFTAHNCDGLVTWSTGATGVSMTTTPTAPSTTYWATCTVNGCTSDKSKDAVITVLTETPTITASSETVCAGGQVTLTASNCSGTLKWSTGATTATITPTITATTTYTVTCTVENCEGKASKTISVGTGTTPTVPTISSNKTSVCGNETATLTASGCNGTVMWSTGSTGSSITVGAGTYSASCKTDCGESAKSNTIIITNGGSLSAPTVTASSSGLCEPGTVSLTAAGCSGTVVWSNGQTGNTISVNLSATTTFSATCKAGECISPASSNVTITVGKPNKPTISANNTTVCAGDRVTLTATGCDGGTVVWSNGLTGASVNVNPTTTTDYTAVCKLAQGGCTSDASNKVTVTVTQRPDSPTISCSASRICKGDTLTLNALGCSGSVLWNTGQTTASIAVSPEVTTVYTAICKIGGCESAPSAAATINVGNPIPPVVTCKNTVICGGTSTQIEAAGCTGTVVWSDGQKGAVITVSPTTLTSYWAICDGGRCQSEKSNVISVQVTGSGLATPTTKDLVNTCPFTTVDLTTGVTSAATTTGGVFVFRTGTTPTSPAVATPSAVGTGTYYVFEKSGNGCYSPAGKINVVVTSCETNGVTCSTNPATANAGKDSTICLGVNDYFMLNGKIGGAATSAKWTTDGKGTFENSLSVSTKYMFAQDDIQKGSVKFTLTTNDPDDNGSCTAATSSFTLTINAVKDRPTVETNKSPNICFGDSVVLTATQTGKYLWSNGATTKSITVKTPGVYTVKMSNDAGCYSLKSAEITVKLSDAIAAPSVTALTKNTCPATSVNLNSAVTSQPKTTNGVFEFRTSNSPASPMLADASAVLGGTYYVFEKSTIGCYSPASQIIVSIDQCGTGGGGGTTDTTAVDPSITIVGSRVEIKVGDELTYTITVKNNSTKPATNVKVENTLPAGLTITVPASGLTADGNILKTTIGTLAAGETKTYTYTAKLTKAGQVVNTAKIVGADQTDPVTSNNISQYSVECKTCQETCVAMSFAADTTRQANGSYNVTFRAFIEACGNVKLEGVKITENLATMFPSPVTFTVIQKPTAGVGSQLKTNDSFNGTTDLNLTIPEGSIIEAGKIDTVKFVVNIVPNGNEGPFSTNAVVDAIGNTIFGIPQDVSDVSNNGTIIDKVSAEPTVVKLFKSPSIGLAKAWTDTLKKSDGSYDITYRILVKNNGSLALSNVVVRDTLTNVFKSPATFTVVGSATKNASSQLAINPAFNGSTDVNITLPTSTLAIGKTDTLKFVVNVKPSTVTKFSNIAVASGTGTLASGNPQTVTDISNSGSNPDAPGSNPTDLTLGGQGQGGSINEPCIGIALAVKDTVKQSDGSYNIIYQAIIKNCGNVNLTNVQMCDTLSNTFNSPAVAQIFAKPTVNAGSTLKVNNDYNGITNTCLLASGSELAPAKIDTVRWTVNVKLNDNKGPFRNNVTVTATGGTQTVKDVSNDGTNPDPAGNAATVVNFNVLPAALIGIAKDASTPVAVEGKANTYDVTYTLKVKNYGREDFTKVQVQDNLSVTFGDSVKIDSVKVTADAGFTANSKFTGKGNLINLLVDSTSTLPKGTTRNIKLFVRVDLSGASTRTFNNAALAIGTYGNGLTTDDQSVKGDNPDPDADGTPKNNTGETPAKFGDGGIINPSIVTPLGIAKHATLDSTANADGSYNVTYKVVIKNYGTRALTNVQLSDTLSKVFADSSDYILNGKPTLNASSKLKLDGTFNGKDKTGFFVADSSSLAVGKSDTLTFKVIVFTEKQSASFSNSIYGSAKDSTKTVIDLSQSGLVPDKNGDNNPGNDNEATVFTITKDSMPLDSLVSIPEGFSPNGDSNGDTWKIPGINGTDRTAEVYIYNRWGQLVYKNEDFGKATDGWNGMTNSGGLVLGNKGVGVPDGTYFYCIKADGLFQGKVKTGFITLVR